MQRKAMQASAPERFEPLRQTQTMKCCLHCKAVRDFIKKYIGDSAYYQIICTICNRVAWVGC